jgi:peptide/nickel transport system substrate-binding protein
MDSQSPWRAKVSRRTALKMAAASASAAALAACLPQSAAPTSAPGASTVAAAPPGNLAIGFAFGPNTLDPHFWVNFRDQDIVTHLFDPLIYRKPTGEFVGNLVESWKRVDDNTLQFKLRKGVTYQNGKPWNADAMKYNFARMVDPALKATIASAKLIKLVRGDVIDEFTVNMVTASPLSEPGMQLRLSDVAMVEPSYYTGLAPDAASRTPVGSGPFKLVEFVKDDHLTMEPYKEYWRRAEIWGGNTPKIGTLTWKILPEVATRMAAVQTGALDIAWDIPLDVAQNVSGAGVRAIVTPTDGRMFIGMNQTKPFLKDVRVRQALNYAVNWDVINKSLFQGKAPRLSSWVAVQSSNYNSSTKAYPYDPDKAKSLLQAAGVPTGHKLVCMAQSSLVGSGTLAQAIGQDFAKVGITLESQVVEATIYAKRLVDRTADDLWLGSFGGGSDDGQGALTTLDKSFDRSAYAWDNAEWDKLFASLNGAAALDLALRRTTILRLQEIAMEDAPVVFLAARPIVHVVGPRVKAWEPRFDQLFMPWEVQLA